MEKHYKGKLAATGVNFLTCPHEYSHQSGTYLIFLNSPKILHLAQHGGPASGMLLRKGVDRPILALEPPRQL